MKNKIVTNTHTRVCEANTKDVKFKISKIQNYAPYYSDTKREITVKH